MPRDATSYIHSLMASLLVSKRLHHQLPRVSRGATKQWAAQLRGGAMERPLVAVKTDLHLAPSCSKGSAEDGAM